MSNQRLFAISYSLTFLLSLILLWLSSGVAADIAMYGKAVALGVVSGTLMVSIKGQ